MENNDVNTDGQETTSSDFDVDGFLSQAQGGDSSGEAPDKVPEKFGEVPFSQFESALVEATGEKVKGFQDLQGLLEKNQKLTEYEKRIQELQQKASRYTFANEKVKRLNELYADGASAQEIDLFLKMQDFDVDSLDNLEAVRMKYKQEDYGLNDEEINALLEDEFGTLDLEEMEPSKRAHLKKKAKEAKKYFADLKVQANEPESVRQKRIQQQRLEQRKQTWANVNSRLVKDVSRHEFQLELSGDNSIKLDWEIPNAEKFVNQVLLRQLNDFATQFDPNKVNPMEYTKQVEKIKERVLFATYGPEIIKAIAEHAFATSKKEQVAKHHNVDPVRRGKRKEKVELSTATQKFLEKKRKEAWK